jgi:hypothetical protein
MQCEGRCPVSRKVEREGRCHVRGGGRREEVEGEGRWKGRWRERGGGGRGEVEGKGRWRERRDGKERGGKERRGKEKCVLYLITIQYF